MSRSQQRKKISSAACVAFLFLLLVWAPAGAQNKKDLESKKKNLQKEINETNDMLRETRKNKQISLGKLVMLNKMISAREELIGSISSEIGILDKQIVENTSTINSLKKDLYKLKAEYARMVYFAWKNRDAYTRMMFVFASKDFSQAYMRLKYFQQYSDYRKKQAMMIEQTQAALNGQIVQLEARKTDKKTLLVSQEGEKQNLTVEKKEKEETLVQLQDKEQQLKRELDKKKKDAEKLQLAIKKVIEEEIAKAKKEEEERQKKLAANNPKGNKTGTPNKTGTSPSLTPESIELSASFAGNKGKLPWPVLKGVITEGFGEHEHPTLAGVVTFNNGIDIATTKGALVRSVFDGEVKSVGILPGAGKFVIIRHGEYLSVYSNLSEVYVNTGDKVKTKQNIATALFDDEDAKTLVQLQVWKGQVKLDPEEWLSKSSR
jgi:septal ring factor EnvC (AmiA/AmiB activator)